MQPFWMIFIGIIASAIVGELVALTAEFLRDGQKNRFRRVLFPIVGAIVFALVAALMQQEPANLPDYIGMVTDKEGKGIPRVLITHRGEPAGQTDANGRYYISSELIHNQTDIRILAEVQGFEPHNEIVGISSDSTFAVATIVLKRVVVLAPTATPTRVPLATPTPMPTPTPVNLLQYGTFAEGWEEHWETSYLMGEKSNVTTGTETIAGQRGLRFAIDDSAVAFLFQSIPITNTNLFFQGDIRFSPAKSADWRTNLLQAFGAVPPSIGLALFYSTGTEIKAMTFVTSEDERGTEIGSIFKTANDVPTNVIYRPLETPWGQVEIDIESELRDNLSGVNADDLDSLAVIIFGIAVPPCYNCNIEIVVTNLELISTTAD